MKVDKNDTGNDIGFTEKDKTLPDIFELYTVKYKTIKLV